MNILITGASGLVGGALRETLTSLGHTVYAMHRDPASDQPFHWWPPTGRIHFDPTIAIDGVIHLAGASIADGRWNARRKQLILRSRVQSTQLLASALAQMPVKPAVFISGSAIGYYGHTGDRWVDESSAPGDDFLAMVARQWEQAAEPAELAGIRTVLIRTGMVLSRQGGALQKMLPPFKLGLGGRIGSGNQFISWVRLQELCQMIAFIFEHSELSGPINLVSSPAVTNAEFSATLARALGRPALLPMPGWLARLLFGEVADLLLLSSTRVKPTRLQEAGYPFIDNSLEAAIGAVLRS